jgi:hypothetical protein
MALTKEVIADKVEAIENGSVQVRTATIINEDGAELSRSFHRHVLHPSTKTEGSWGDTDISSEEARVQAICDAVWTDSVKTEFQEQSDAN